jgi:Protein of unknown function (DUF4236)
MKVRFRRSLRYGPVRLNLSRRGLGVSLSFMGVTLSFPVTGPPALTASLPGTGLSVREPLTQLLPALMPPEAAPAKR